MEDEEQQDELQALHSIFNTDMTEISSYPPCFVIKLTDLEVTLPGSVSIRFTMHPGYPGSKTPGIEIPMRNKVISDKHLSDLLQHLQTAAEENIGMPVIFTLVDAAQQWINSNIQEVEETSADDEIPEQDISSVSPIQLTEPKTTGGRWEYIIGLVGKPSAGKSTFFNAATKKKNCFTSIYNNRT